MNNNPLRNGFISVNDAVALINSDKRDDAKVDTQWLAGHIDWIEEAHNFRIPVVRFATREEIEAQRKAHPGRRPNGLISLGSKYVEISTSYEKELLKKTIRDHYREMAGREYAQEITRGISTVMDEETGNSERPRKTKKTIAKEGETIGTGSSRTTNSADGAGV